MPFDAAVAALMSRAPLGNSCPFDQELHLLLCLDLSNFFIQRRAQGQVLGLEKQRSRRNRAVPGSLVPIAPACAA